MLDTHVLLWASEGNRKIGRKARRLIDDPEMEIWLSAMSVWEIANKVALGRLHLREPVRDWLLSETRQNHLIPLPFTHEHASAAAELPRHHEDPFDRMLIAQAQVEDLRIITADAQFGRYDVRLIDATL
jgi:PIN domain nuclease of toxin-antitoxin system